MHTDTMKLLLVLTVCVTLAAASTASDDLSARLARVLVELSNEKRQDGDQGGDQGGQPQLPPEINPEDFKDVLHEVGEHVHDFLEKITKIRPRLMHTLTGGSDWSEVADDYSNLLGHGIGLHQTIMHKAGEIIYRLLANSKGFKDMGRCKALEKLTEHIDIAADPRMASVETIEAMLSDLDCMSDELLEELGGLEKSCLESKDLTINDAFKILSDMFIVMHRYGVDGERFVEANSIIGEKWMEYKSQQPDPPASRGLNKLLEVLHSTKK